jgi:hypothetical protein
MSPEDVARSLRRSPFTLLAWVLSGLVPAVLVGECRPLVLRALLDLGTALRASLTTAATKEQTTLSALEERSRAAVVALGEDYRALTEEVLPPPSANIDGPTVARVLYAFLADMFEGPYLQAAVVALLGRGDCDRLATRASAVESPSEKPIEKKQR